MPLDTYTEKKQRVGLFDTTHMDYLDNEMNTDIKHGDTNTHTQILIFKEHNNIVKLKLY